MSLTSATFKTIFTCDNSTVDFDFDFKVFEEGDLEVILHTIATGAESTLTLTTDYTTSSLTDTGGRVTTVATYATTYKLIVRRNQAKTQEVDYTQNDSFSTTVLEQGLDQMVMQTQDLAEVTGRVVVQESTQTTPLVMPLPESEKIIGWNTGATALENKVAVDADVAAAAQASADAAAASAATIDLTAPGPIGGTTANTGTFTDIVGVGTTTLNDSGNATVLRVANDGTSHGLYITQDIALPTNSYALYVHSNVAQTTATSPLIYFRQQEATSTQGVLTVIQEGVGSGLVIYGGGTPAAGKYLLHVYTNDAHTYANQPGILFQFDNAASDELVFQTSNDGTGSNVEFTQVGALKSGAVGFKVNLTGQNDDGGTGVSFIQEHASTTDDLLNLRNDGTGTAQYINQSGVLASAKNALWVYSNVAQVNSPLVFLEQDSGSSTADVLSLQNDGTGTSEYIDQVGVLAANKNALWVYSNVAQINSPLVFLEQDNASSTADVLSIQNDGTGMGLLINQVGDLASGKNALKVMSDTDQDTTGLVFFYQKNASSSVTCLTVENDGTGIGLNIDQDGNKVALNIDSEVANDGDFVNIDEPGQAGAFKIMRNTDLTQNVVLKLGAGYIWVDTTGDLRISATNPTSDTGGTVVGTQS